MTYPMIFWEEPEATEDIAYWEVYRSATETGTYELIETIVAKAGGEWILSHNDTGGTETSWYKIRALNSAETPGAYSTARQADYNMTIYTTIEILKGIIPNVTPTVGDNDMRKGIVDAENYIDAGIQTTFKPATNFDPLTKHGTIRTLATKVAIINTLEDDIINQLGSAQGGILIDSIKDDVGTIMESLKDPRIVEYLLGL